MEHVMEEIIKNIIHIDKSAVELREKLENEIKDRKSKIDDEVEKLRSEIINSALEKAEKKKDAQIRDACNEAELIKKSAEKKAQTMYEKYIKNRDKFLDEVFKEIFSGR